MGVLTSKDFWNPNTHYYSDSRYKHLIEHNNQLYVCTESHISGASFDFTKFTSVSGSGSGGLSGTPWDITTGSLPINATPGVLLEVSGNGEYLGVSAVDGDIVLVNNDMTISNLTGKSAVVSTAVLSTFSFNNSHPARIHSTFSGGDLISTMSNSVASNASSIFSNSRLFDDTYPNDIVRAEITMVSDAASYGGSRSIGIGVSSAAAVLAGNITNTTANVVFINKASVPVNGYISINGDIQVYDESWNQGDVFDIVVQKSLNTVLIYQNGQLIFLSDGANLNQPDGVVLFVAQSVQGGAYNATTDGQFIISLNTGQTPYTYDLPTYNYPWLESQSVEFQGVLKVVSLNWNPNLGYPSSPNIGDLHYASYSGTISGTDIIPGMGIWYDGVGWRFLDDAIHAVSAGGLTYAGDWVNKSVLPTYIEDSFYNIKVDMSVLITAGIVFRQIPKGSILICKDGNYILFSTPATKNNEKRFPKHYPLLTDAYGNSNTVADLDSPDSIYDATQYCPIGNYIADFGVGSYDSDEVTELKRGTCEVIINNISDVATSDMDSIYFGFIKDVTRYNDIGNTHPFNTRKSFGVYVSLSGKIYVNDFVSMPNTYQSVLLSTTDELVDGDKLVFHFDYTETPSRFYIIKNGDLIAVEDMNGYDLSSSSAFPWLGGLRFMSGKKDTLLSSYNDIHNAYKVNYGYDNIEYVIKTNDNITLENGLGVFKNHPESFYIKKYENIALPTSTASPEGYTSFIQRHCGNFRAHSASSDNFLIKKDYNNIIQQYLVDYSSEINQLESLDKYVAHVNAQVKDSYTFYLIFGILTLTDLPNDGDSFRINFDEFNPDISTGLSNFYITQQNVEGGIIDIKIFDNLGNAYYISESYTDTLGRNCAVVAITFSQFIHTVNDSHYLFKYAQAKLSDGTVVKVYDGTIANGPCVDITTSPQFLTNYTYSYSIKCSVTMPDSSGGIFIVGDSFNLPRLQEYIPAADTTLLTNLDPGTITYDVDIGNSVTLTPRKAVIIDELEYANFNIVNSTGLYKNDYPLIADSLKDSDTNIFVMGQSSTDGIHLYGPGDLCIFDKKKSNLLMTHFQRKNEIVKNAYEYTEFANAIDINASMLNQVIKIDHFDANGKKYIQINPTAFFNQNYQEEANGTSTNKAFETFDPSKSMRWVVINITNMSNDPVPAYFRFLYNVNWQNLVTVKPVGDFFYNQWIFPGDTKVFKLYGHHNIAGNQRILYVEDITPGFTEKISTIELVPKSEAVVGIAEPDGTYYVDKSMFIDSIDILNYANIQGTLTLVFDTSTIEIELDGMPMQTYTHNYTNMGNASLIEPSYVSSMSSFSITIDPIGTGNGLSIRVKGY